MQVVPENKGREAKVRGICMAKRRRGFRTSFTLLNHVPGGGTVERSFPLCVITLISLHHAEAVHMKARMAAKA